MSSRYPFSRSANVYPEKKVTDENTAAKNPLFSIEPGYEIVRVSEQRVKAGIINFCNNFAGTTGSYDFGAGGGGPTPSAGLTMWALTLTLVGLQTAVVRSIILPRIIEHDDGESIQVLGYITGRTWSDHKGGQYRDAASGRIWLKPVDEKGRIGDHALESCKLGYPKHPAFVQSYPGLVYVGEGTLPLPKVAYKTGPLMLEVTLSSDFGLQFHRILLVPKFVSAEQTRFFQRLRSAHSTLMMRTPFILTRDEEPPQK